MTVAEHNPLASVSVLHPNPSGGGPGSKIESNPMLIKPVSEGSLLQGLYSGVSLLAGVDNEINICCEST